MSVHPMLLVAVASAVLAVPRSVLAATPRVSAAEVAAREAARVRARALANQGYVLFKAGRHADALTYFQRAEVSFHAPTIVLMLGRTQRKLGRDQDAVRALQAVVAEPLDPGSPREFRDAKSDAKDELDALFRERGRLAWESAGSERVELRVDGSDVDAPAPGRPIPIAVGRHRIELRVDGEELEPYSVQLDAGAEHVLGTHVEGGRRGAIVGSAVSFGVAAVGVGLGIGFGVSSLSALGELERRCPSRVCTVAERELADDANRRATFSTVGFAVAGAGAALGATLLIVNARGANDDDDALALEVRTDGVWVSGAF